MLVNPTDIPLVVKITNGIDVHEVMLPAKKSREILAGYTLHPDSKHQFPQIVDTNPPQKTETPAAVAAPTVIENTGSAETETAAENTVASETPETTTRPVISKKKS